MLMYYIEGVLGWSMETYLLFIIFFAVNPVSCVIMLFLEVELKDKIFIKTYNS